MAIMTLTLTLYIALIALYARTQAICDLTINDDDIFLGGDPLPDEADRPWLEITNTQHD